MLSPKTRKATADGAMKKATRCIASFRRRQSAFATASSGPVWLDISGSSAFEIDILKRLTGNRYTVCAYARAATAPVGRKLARMESI